ncbi:hypothetical protein JHK82_039579 [Glycine max]|nr:hypothetical protein JHK86_039767 [Glycine max]KAG4965369.1 hypothetical protein JHK85_040344 [Glycine max]KAG5110356.1 hypothetical protein JHK82_039579 [Glycine max]KAG5121641.1 hypothetical protein JHK84_039981 [Glycine max]
MARLQNYSTILFSLSPLTATELTHCVPDIGCFRELMTGGIIPLAVTLAKNAVFDTFIGDSKLKALLHGHSYSAHAMGCAAGIKSIQWFKDPCSNPLTSLLKEDYLGRCPSSPAVIHERIQRFSNMLAEHQATGSGNLVESDHDSAPSPINTSGEKNLTDSKELITGS